MRLAPWGTPRRGWKGDELTIETLEVPTREMPSAGEWARVCAFSLKVRFGVCSGKRRETKLHLFAFLEMARGWA